MTIIVIKSREKNQFLYTSTHRSPKYIIIYRFLQNTRAYYIIIFQYILIAIPYEI